MTDAYPEPQVSGIREITASGEHWELGFHHGRAAQDLISSVYELRMKVASRGATVRSVLDQAITYVPFVERHAPELLDEVRGIGEGAEIGFERALFLQVASELEPKPEGGCSSFGTSLVALGPIVAQNWDTTEDYVGKEVVLRLRPRGKPALMMFTIAGVIGYIGQNEHGVGQVANSLYSDSRRTGLSGYFIMRKFLEARSVDEAVSWLRGVKIGSNGNYLLGDASGSVADVELGGGTFQVMYHRAQVHTNHYLGTGWKAKDRAMVVLPDSYPRYLRMAELLADGRDRSRALAALKDHKGFPVGVCRHQRAPGLRTTASVVHELGARQMLVCCGNPCRAPYRRFALGGPPTEDGLASLATAE
jgi:isopenicillin-N N-acyltransferase-like protein